MTDQDNAGKELRDKIEMYRESIIHADKPERAEQVWDTAPETSFIHPRGHERGWEAIRDNFYTKTMANTFSRRELRLTGEPVVHLYGDAAVAEFDWEFTATRRARLPVQSHSVSSTASSRAKETVLNRWYTRVLPAPRSGLGTPRLRP